MLNLEHLVYHNTGDPEPGQAATVEIAASGEYFQMSAEL